jgi:purine-binding chemotaxis protein CheW
MRRKRQDPSKNLVGFTVGDVTYAVPIDAVREIVNPLPVVDLPRSPPSVRGVADYRNEVVPVVDLRARFGLASAPATRRTKWLVVRAAGHLVALVVDAVTEVFRGEEALRPTPPTGTREGRYIFGVTTRRGKLVFVLDLERLARDDGEEATT